MDCRTGGPADAEAAVRQDHRRKFRAYDKATGERLWEFELPAGTTGAPMTYMFDGKQYIVVAVGSTDVPAEFIALSLP
jgi:quinoprotein glucose dehydrogenase